MINRIFQGRATGVEVLDEDNNAHALTDWNDKLWRHHELFQDATNYYLVCLLSLASEPDNELTKIREEMTNPASDAHVWEEFSRRGLKRLGLAQSVAQYLTPNENNPSFDQAAAAVLAGNSLAETSDGRRILDAGLQQLLARCTGSSGCRNAAPEFLPRFCKPDFGGNFAEDLASVMREIDKRQFPFVVHDPTTSPQSSRLQRFGVHSIALPNPKKPEFRGDEAKAKLREMLGAWREREPKSELDWARLEAAISGLGNQIVIPGYAATSAKGEIKFQLFAMFQFRYVEQSEFTLGLLRSVTRAPKENAAPPAENDSIQSKGDPIRLARGTRGYVFRAFTSLPGFRGDDSGKPQWIEFDVASFEEALKALHQVDEKGKERRKELKQKLTQLEYQRQIDASTKEAAPRKWKAGASDEEDQRPPVLVADPRISRLEQLVDHKLKAEYEMTEGVGVEYGLHPRTIRGFRDLRKKWSEIIEPGEAYSEAARQKLWDSLTDYKKENAETIGSPVLFDALVEEENWIIWREPTPEQLTQWRKEAKLATDMEFAKDPLQALTDERELLVEIERLKKPIRLTPADPVHSRRQFYFSDVAKLTERGEYRHEPNQQTVIVPLAIKEDDAWKQRRVRLHYSAPRLMRDGLRSDDGEKLAAMPWLQPMMGALRLPDPMPQDFRFCPVALMPDVAASGEKRIFLNFPLTLDEELLVRQMQAKKKRRWDNYQFAGADGDFYWLRWPSTWAEKAKSRPWWESDEPFSYLSFDLGQNEAGACACSKVSAGVAPKTTSRRLGEAGGHQWWNTVIATNVLRLPGENAMVMRDGKWQQEFYGERGRMATGVEWTEARDICKKLGFSPDRLLGKNERRYSFPELNNQLLYALRRAQARLARLQSWSCVAYEEPSPKKRAAFEKQRERIKEQISQAIESRAAEQENNEEQRGQELLERNEWLSAVKPFSEIGAWDAIATLIKREIESEREVIQCELVRIADRIQPLRERCWEWVRRGNDKNNFWLKQTERGTDNRKKLLAGQRGLSFKRIEQLESLRQRCQSLNRALQHIPGEKPEQGARGKGKERPDPCPELLDRLDALKEQRVNQTAHLILVQALGVRLKRHTSTAAEREKHDIHGEYEPIPGRGPVDFIVIENLKYYEMSQSRARSQNARLMKWCRRRLRDKLIQLCEPYGLRVLEEWPADTSKFCSLTSVAGFRAVELTPDDAEKPRWQKHLCRLNDPERAKKLNEKERGESEHVKAIFTALENLNSDLLKNRPTRPKWRTLLAPVDGGPIFVPLRGNPFQADINAAINLGLRAVAAPEHREIHLRIRSERKEDKFFVRANNLREKARWGAKPPEVVIPNSKHRADLQAEAHPLFFADTGNIADFDRAEIFGQKGFASSRGIRGTVNQKNWLRVGTLNNDRLEKADLGRPLDEDDDVPM